MPLDPTQEQTLQRWLSQNTAELLCPLCGTGAAWVPGEVFTGNPVYPGDGGPGTSRPPIRMVQVICDSCGYLLLFSAEKVGL